MNIKNYFIHKTDEYPKLWQFIKYCLVGGTGTIVDVGIYSILTRYFHFYYLYSTCISVFIAIFNNFILNKYWTFKKGKSGQSKNEYVKFFIVSVFSYLLHLGIMTSIIELTHLESIFGNYEDFVAKFIAIIIVTISNYIGNKYWTFKD